MSAQTTECPRCHNVLDAKGRCSNPDCKGKGLWLPPKPDPDEPRAPNPKHAKDYEGRPNGCNQGNAFSPFDSTGYQVIKVLPFLNGKKWDDVALGWLHALRPSIIRVVKPTEGTQLDAREWRVTVYITKAGAIEEIKQEVRVGLPDGVRHGSALETATQFGMDSPEFKWECISGMTCYTPTGVYKLGDDGKTHPFPERRKRRKP